MPENAPELGRRGFEKMSDVGWGEAVEHAPHIDKGTAVQRGGQLIECFLGCRLILSHVNSQRKTHYRQRMKLSGKVVTATT